MYSRSCTAAVLVIPPDWVHIIYIIMSQSASQVSSVAGAVAAEAAEPEGKRRRLLDAGGPVEDDETARQKMRDAMVGENGEITGFDPQKGMEVRGFNRGNDRISPMGYFAYGGDLPMMRWLYVNGADTQGPDLELMYPMNAAAMGVRAEETVKWLFFHGAAKDVTRTNTEKRPGSPFNYLLGHVYRRQKRLVRWLILNGAFCRNEDNHHECLDIKIMKKCLGWTSFCHSSRRQYAYARQDLLEWATELNETRTSFLTFLKGTVSRQEGKVTSPIACLGRESGIMELMADYLGAIRGREARIIRQLIELLPGVHMDLEDEESESE